MLLVLCLALGLELDALPGGAPLARLVVLLFVAPPVASGGKG